MAEELEEQVARAGSVSRRHGAPPWQVEADDRTSLHVVVAGSFHLAREAAPILALAQGDLVLVAAKHPHRLRCVATDGHRLALAEAKLDGKVSAPRQVIVPRKGVNELQGLFEGGDASIELEFARNHLRVRREGVTFTSKLIDGRFPDYEAVIPIGADREVKIDREAFRASLQRAAILSNEKYRGVKIEVSPGVLKVIAHNPEQEEAMEEIEAETTVDQLSVGFNVNYLLDALSAVDGVQVRIRLRDGASSALVESPVDDTTRHVVMPLRL